MFSSYFSLFQSNSFVKVVCCLLAIKAPSVIQAEVQKLTADNFMDVIDGPHHKLVKFYAPWCKYCQIIERPYKYISEANPVEDSNIIFAEVNGAEEPILMEELVITEFPTYLYFLENDSDNFKEVELGFKGDLMVAAVNKLFNLTTEIEIPAYAPEWITDLKSGQDFLDAVTSRGANYLLVNFYGETCPGDCFMMHMNLPLLAKVFQYDDIQFARFSGEGRYDIVKRFDANHYPAFVLFPPITEDAPLHDYDTGEYAHVTMSDFKGSSDPEAVLTWLNGETGIGRDSTGNYALSTTNNAQLDEIIRQATSITDPQLLMELETAVATLATTVTTISEEGISATTGLHPTMEMAYVRIAKDVLSNGEDYVRSEVTRLEKAVHAPSIKKEERDELFRALNVVRVFHQQLVPLEELSAEESIEETGDVTGRLDEL